ncbi:MAG: hypothetical protein R3C49_18610 [Planctomycetaceae bacterium]
MPDDLLCTILLHHRMEVSGRLPEEQRFLILPCTLAALLPDQLNQVPDGMNRLLEADSRSSAFGLDRLCQRVDEQLDQITEGHDVPLYLTPHLVDHRQLPADRR